MPNMLVGRNFGGGGINNYTASGNNNHGNACAGIIGAAHNNGEGIAGIAPNCKILPIKISSTSASDWYDAIIFAKNNADVISCSSGIPDRQGILSTDPNLHPIVVDAIRLATTSGRRGSKGSVLAFAASNSADHTQGNNGKILFRQM